MKKRHIIFLLLIVIGLVSIIFSITYALTISVSEGTSSDYDLSYTFTISDDTWTVTVPAGKTKVYEIALTNPYSDSIRYGVAYKINNSDISLEDVSITTTKDSSSLPEDLIGSNVNKNISVMIENNSTSDIEVNLIIVNGYKNGGDLIVPEGYNLVEEYNLALITLTSLGLSVSEGTPDFSKTSCTSGCDEATVGIYKTQDNLGDTYYFRGDVENNYVYFAGYYWRIIRINGDGSIRMIYDGTSAHANGDSSTDRYMGETAYNSSYNDNAYVGYMYGTTGAGAYDATHANTNSSTIKTYLDNWYKTNIVDAGYSSYVVDAIYCNDREVDTNAGSLNGYTGYTTLGYGTNKTNYATNARVGYNISNPSPTLECSRENDKFTVNSSLGNGALTYPVGLITADEVAMAGGKYGINNSSYYLYMGSWYWTMSPYLMNGSNARSLGVYSSGYLYFYGVNIYNLGGRGVISIEGSAINAGSGTSTDPFKIENSGGGTTTGSSSETLTLLGLTSNGTKSSFASAATTNEGVFEAEDDLGTSYYFRGAVTNNYVKFAGYYWRIIRINGDGSIRMIYDGTKAHTNGESSTDRYIGTSAYNTNYGDNAYVGYMYGSAGASTYAATHANTNDSTIKTYLDSWYETNIKDTDYEQYVADAIYCNDREVSSGTGIGGTNSTYYKAYNRLELNKTPALQCTQGNDKFTVNSSLGNGALEYPIGLITADEVSMAGGVYGTNNSSYYLYMGCYYWIMSPYYCLGPLGSIASSFYDGEALSSSYVNETESVRPVISISPSAIKYGNGTSTNPFRLTESI